MTKTDFAIIFKNEKLNDKSLSLSSIVASQNVNKFFDVKPLTEKAKKYNFELKIKDENSSFASQSLQNFTLSWKVNVLDPSSFQILQTLDVDDQTYSQKIKVNQVFNSKEIFSQERFSIFSQYYNPSIWYVGNNTYFARADANTAYTLTKSYAIRGTGVKQVETWSYDGGKTWTRPQVFLELNSDIAGRPPSVANGLTIYDSSINKLIFIANFWAANIGPDSKMDSGFGLNANGLWKVWRMHKNWGGIISFNGDSTLILVDDSEFDTHQTLYYKIYTRQKDLTAAQVRDFYQKEQAFGNQTNILGNAYQEEKLTQSMIDFWPQTNQTEKDTYLNGFAWVRLKYDPQSGKFTSKIVNQATATTLEIAKTMFDSQNIQIFDGVPTNYGANSYGSFTVQTLSGPYVFAFEKDLNVPVDQRQWKLISKYPENYEFADKNPDGSKVKGSGWQYINLQPGNGVVLKNGTYGVLFNHMADRTNSSTFKPTLVTGKYEVDKNRIWWENRGQAVHDVEKKLMFSQIGNGSDSLNEKFAFLTSFNGGNKDLLFYYSNPVSNTGEVIESKADAVLEDSKNTLGFPIDHRSFRPGFAGFQSAQGKSWFIVAGPSKQSGVSFNQDGLILLVNSDFSRIYPIDKILGGFQNSVINIESATKTTEGWTNVKFVISYEIRGNYNKTNVRFKKFDLDLDLRGN